MIAEEYYLKKLVDVRFAWVETLLMESKALEEVKLRVFSRRKKWRLKIWHKVLDSPRSARMKLATSRMNYILHSRRSYFLRIVWIKFCICGVLFIKTEKMI